MNASRMLPYALLSLAVFSCSQEPAAGITLYLQTDIVVPDGIDAVSLVLANEETGAVLGTPITRSVIDGSVRLPSTLVLETAFDEPTFSFSSKKTRKVNQVRISLIGLHGDRKNPAAGVATVLRRVVTTMPVDGMHALRIQLNSLDQGSVAPLPSGPATGAAFEANYLSIKSNCPNGGAFDRISGICVLIPDLKGDELPLSISVEQTPELACFSTEVFSKSDVERIAQFANCSAELLGAARTKAAPDVAVGYAKNGALFALDYASASDVATSGIPAAYTLENGTLKLASGVCNALQSGEISAIVVAPSSPAKRVTQGSCPVSAPPTEFGGALGAAESYRTTVTAPLDFALLDATTIRVFGTDPAQAGNAIVDVHSDGTASGLAGSGFGARNGFGRVRVAGTSTLLLYSDSGIYTLNEFRADQSQREIVKGALQNFGAFFYEPTSDTIFHSANIGPSESRLYSTERQAGTPNPFAAIFATSISASPRSGNVFVTANDQKMYEYSATALVNTFSLPPTINDLRAAMTLSSGRIALVAEGASGSFLYSAASDLTSSSVALRFSDATTHIPSAPSGVAFLPKSASVSEDLLFVAHAGGIEAFGFRATFEPYSYGWVAKGAGVPAIETATIGGKSCVYFAAPASLTVDGQTLAPGQYRRCFK